MGTAYLCSTVLYRGFQGLQVRRIPHSPLGLALLCYYSVNPPPLPSSRGRGVPRYSGYYLCRILCLICFQGQCRPCTVVRGLEIYIVLLTGRYLCTLQPLPDRYADTFHEDGDVFSSSSLHTISAIYEISTGYVYEIRIYKSQVVQVSY